ncbi:ATP-binding protein [Brevundimonas aveniformis]|uniref:ATP-binding protein n=1 Tax=Brevundimonas aveniformis TaxID=370977 RepID=UPI000421D209|nr:ATP-binding protein [Brevundimonas aveniformis]
MTSPRLSLPIFVQIAALVAVSIALAMAICFAAILHAPPPAQPGFTIDEAVSALEGQTVRTAEGRSLKRTVSDTAPVAAQADQDPLARVISLALQRRLNLEADAVRVRVPVVDGAEHRRIHNELGGRWSPQDGGGTLSLGQQRRTETIIIRRGPGGQQPTDAAPPTVPPPGSRVQVLTEDIRGTSEGHARQQITVFTEELRFPPFIASVRLEDGRWATVSPPSGLWSPWHTRMLLTFLGTLALLLPLAWLMARRLARPIRLFAQAAERLGSDPHAPPLDVTGPAEVRNAAHAFNDMQTQLNRYVEGRTQMVAAIAHDLRTPLTRLRFRAEQADPEIRDRMAEDIEQMNGMISQALSYVRGETVREDRVPLDLSALAASVVHDLNEVGADASVEASPGVRVMGESLNLRRALANLVENAVKFAGSAQVTVTTEPGLGVVTVFDTGPGLSPDELETVFEPFHRGEKSRNRDTGGTGLGLAVARGAARAHGGDVVLFNRDGGGLAARLTLPLSP